MTTTPKKPAAPSAATLAKKLKATEAKLAIAEQAIIEFNKLNATERADYGNGQYTLGFEEGYAQKTREVEASAAAQSVIGRFFSR